MPKPTSRAANALRRIATGLAVILSSINVASQDLPPPSAATAIAVDGPAELQLEVYINGISTELIATFRKDGAGALLADPQQLENVGIIAAGQARHPDGWIDIARLPGVTAHYDEQSQIIRFTATDAARAAKIIDVNAKPGAAGDDKNAEKATSSTGGLVNYTLYGSTGGQGWSDITEFQGLSSLLEARAFSPFGILSSSHVVSTSRSEAFDTTRLDTTWSYSDEQRMMTYNAGDFITGGLAWSRPARLGGIQIQRNFALRPDMVTMPLPAFAGSAAVPSTVDIYVDNARRLSQDVPAGPFAITNLPVVTGNGTARVVVRDSLGRETISETPFFASSDLLAKGLADFSAEAGFARRSYGTLSYDYDERLLGSATIRYGASDYLTLESHAEGGENFYNLGFGGVFSLGNHGLGTLAGSMSRFEQQSGYQLAASVETELWGAQIFARTQRTFGDYHDIASVTAESGPSRLPSDGFGARPPRALDQISVSTPLKFDEATLNMSFTRIETFDNIKSTLVGITANRPVGERGNLFVTAYKDLETKGSFGIFAGLSWSFGSNISASTGGSYDDGGGAITADISKSEQQEPGSHGWRLRGATGKNDIVAASASYRAKLARLEAGVEQFNGNTRAYGQIEGSIVAAGGDIFLGGRINDAFAVVDAGAPGIDVLLENRPIGQTNRRGKILLPGLRSYDVNNIAIDPTNLPLDAKIDRTKHTVRPGDRSGAVVDFNVKTGMRPALMTLRDETGAYLEAGSSAKADSGDEFVIGYDGQLYLENATGIRKLLINLPSNGTCEVELPDSRASQSSISGGEAICKAVH